MLEISKGCDILVGTPGRLLDFAGTKKVYTRHNKIYFVCFLFQIRMDNLKYMVFDECDRLLDDSFVISLRDLTEVPNFPEVKFFCTNFF